ncbi:MAG: patatin-like phospholipase family protein [Spirochaeta sp.]|jgi:predicted acylesterase/phospholipase RssA|nr:patatin-like phospholipase family protein [Spirochaeta sp.]
MQLHLPGRSAVRLGGLAAAVLTIFVLGSCASTPTGSVAPEAERVAPIQPEREQISPQLYDLSVTTVGNGYVMPDYPRRVAGGTTLDLAIAPRTGFVVDDVVVAGGSVMASSMTYGGEITLGPIESDTDVTVFFRKERVCLVLSVGGPKGVAHFGAIRALHDNGIYPDAVFGTSMGSLVGGLYATAPDSDIAARYAEFIDAYRERSRAAAITDVTRGAIIGGATATALTIGNVFVGAVGAVAGGAIAFREFEMLENDRFQETLDEFVAGVSVADTPIPFATMYLAKIGNGVQLIVSSEEPLSAAVARSVNNPFLFPDTSLEYVDPGTDRIAAVPIQEADARFAPDRIIAINVTDAPAVVATSVDAIIEEIRIPNLGDTPVEALDPGTTFFEHAYETGYQTVIAYYGRPGHRLSNLSSRP